MPPPSLSNSPIRSASSRARSTRPARSTRFCSSRKVRVAVSASSSSVRNAPSAVRARLQRLERSACSWSASARALEALSTSDMASMKAFRARSASDWRHQREVQFPLRRRDLLRVAFGRASCLARLAQGPCRVALSPPDRQAGEVLPLRRDARSARRTVRRIAAPADPVRLQGPWPPPPPPSTRPSARAGCRWPAHPGPPDSA